MILQKQFSPQDWATSWWSEASLHQTWSKLFSPTFQCFLCGFPAGRIYIYICLHFFLTIFTLFFWPTWQNCSKLGAEKLSTLNVAAFPGQGSLFSDKRFFWKENKSNRPHVWAIRSKRKRKSRPGASSKRPRGGGGRIMLWDQDVVACSAEGNILSPSSVIKISSVHYACLCLSPPRLSPSPRLQLQFGLFQSALIAFVCKNKIVRLRNIRIRSNVCLRQSDSVDLRNSP